jgi:hypothetical protein
MSGQAGSSDSASVFPLRGLSILSAGCVENLADGVAAAWSPLSTKWL